MTKRVKINFVVMIALLSACSSTQFIYFFAEEFIRNEVAYFINLNEEEEVVMSKQVSEIVTWHRTVMLPKYSDFINNIADKLAIGKYSTQDISDFIIDGQSLIEETVVGLSPYASKFLIQYQTSEDIEFMKKKMKKRNKERLLEISKSEEKLYNDRLDRLKSNFKRYFGTLSNEQVSLLKIHARETLGDSQIRLHNRTLRQKVFLKFLKTQPNESELTVYLNKLLLRGHLIINPNYQDFSRTSLERFKELLVNMLSISPVSQREKIIKNLRDYAEDFKNISL